MTKERIEELSHPLLLKRGPERGKYLFRIIEINTCLLVEVGSWGGNHYRRLLNKFIREGGLEGFDLGSARDREILAEVWRSIRELSGGEADGPQTDRLGGEEDGADQVVQPQNQGTDQTQISFIEQRGQEVGSSNLVVAQ